MAVGGDVGQGKGFLLSSWGSLEREVTGKAGKGLSGMRKEVGVTEVSLGEEGVDAGPLG